MSITAKITHIQKLLEILRGEGKLTQEQYQDVITSSQLPEYKNLFYGEIGVKLRYITRADLEISLCKQAKQIADAAKADIKTLAETKTSLYINDLTPYWGNNDQVNAQLAVVNKCDAASISANIGRLIFLLANQHPEALNQKLVDGVNNAHQLTHNFADNNIACDDAKKLIESTTLAVRYAAEMNDVPTEVANAYIEYRKSEMLELVESPCTNMTHF